MPKHILQQPLGRRRFIRQGSLATLGALLGAPIIYGDNLPQGLVPVALQQEEDFYTLFGKDKAMHVLNSRPWNAEGPAHILDDAITPASAMFVRNNGLVPQGIDAATWTLRIEGEAVRSPKEYTLAQLKQRFAAHSYRLTLECGGNGRSEFQPPAKGNQWQVGAVSCAEWTGVRLADVLADAGITDDAVYIGYYGADTHLSGDPNKVVISRGVPLWKAMQEESLLAHQMNGQGIPLVHGYPLRAVFGGFPASASGKWLNRLVVRNQVHDGPKMGGSSYRVPCHPVGPGDKVEEADMCIIESMPVKSLITYPRSGATIPEGQTLAIRGHAWAGELAVAAVDYSIDFGQTWQPAALNAAPNRLAWQQWQATVAFPQTGYYEVWARATDTNGRAQPMLVPGWNPKGYLNNACHRIAVKVV